LVRIHVGDGRDADARRLDDVDGVDADARTDVARRRGVVLGMWIVMMVAMMLPSLVPMLWRYRLAVGRTGETRLGRLTALVAWVTSRLDRVRDGRLFHWASRWRRSRCSSRRWRAPYRSRSVWSS
jgi:predicted metal-binding membrane protein